jgi:hypothetical protein
MMALRTLAAPALGVALLAQPAPAETTDRHRAFQAWQAYCSDASRPKTDATVHYCGGFRFAVSFVPRGGTGAVGAAPPPATMPDGRRAAAEMGRAPAPDGLPPVAAEVGLARVDRSEPSRAGGVLLGGWIDAQ